MIGDAIRQEISRFEAVHPAIYSIYELLEMVHDPLLAQQIREQVMHIEGSLLFRMRLLREKKTTGKNFANRFVCQ